MQKIIADEFRGKDILSVVHRLDTIVNYDKVAVLENGRLVEYDFFGRAVTGRRRHL